MQNVGVFVTQYSSSLSSFVPNFRILRQVFAEKSLTGKKFTDRQTLLQERKKLYTPCILRLFVCFVSLRPLNNLSVMRDGSSWVEPVLS